MHIDNEVKFPYKHRYSSVKMVNSVYTNINVPMACTQPKHNGD